MYWYSLYDKSLGVASGRKKLVLALRTKRNGSLVEAAAGGQ
jgi:hypothetical protein